MSAERMLISLSLTSMLPDVYKRQILYGTDVGTGKLLYVISEQSEQIASRILTEIDRGVTKLSAKGGYTLIPVAPVTATNVADLSIASPFTDCI